MPYRETKVYFDGGHYIAIPPENFPSSTRKRKKPKPPKPKQNENALPTPKEKFETAYSESQSLPKRERKKYIKEKLKDEFQTAEQLKEFVSQNIERKKINAYKRNTRLWRKIYTQGEWHYFVTATCFYGHFYLRRW
jgi:replicative superfamily II helicase